MVLAVVTGKAYSPSLLRLTIALSMEFKGEARDHGTFFATRGAAEVRV